MFSSRSSSKTLMLRMPFVQPWLLFSWLFVTAPVISHADWSNWRGPDFNGSVSSGKYPTTWSTNSVKWKYALPGKGGSTPILLQDRVYLSSPDGGQDSVLALDIQGKLLWQTKLGAESAARHRTLGSSCNSSPVSDGKTLFAYFRSGRLVALDMNGTVRWTNDISAKFGAENLFWDQGSSPFLTDKDIVLARMHHGESWVAGFDKETGRIRWQQRRNFDVPSENDNAYTTPVPFKYKGQSAFLLWGGDHLTAHAVSDGSLLWSCGGFNPDGTANWPAIACPIVLSASATAIIPVGRDDRPKQSRMYAVKLDGKGDVTSTHVRWKREDVGVFVCSPAAYKGNVYLLRPRGDLACLESGTGKTLWTGALPRASTSFYASPVIANGILYAAREDGTVYVVRVDKGFELVSEIPMGERIVASPSLDKGRLFLRGDKTLFCIEIK